MRGRFITIILATVAFVAMSLAGAFAAEVDWVQPPFDDILKKAQKENKHIFIDFYTTWCGPCKKLDKVTYKDEKVAGYLNSIVAVKYDAEKGEGEELAKRFKVKMFPSLVLLGPDGKEVDRHIGYLDPGDFIDVIEGYQKGIGTVAFYEEQLKKNPDDVSTLYKLGTKYAEAVWTDEAKASFEKILAIDPDSELKAEIWSNLGYAMYADERYEDAAGYYNKLIEEFPDGKTSDEALQMLARVYHKMDKPDKSVETYMVYVDRHSEDPSALNSFAWFCAKRKIGFDQALPVALKAVELSDRDAGILDTLAELYYAMGDYENAIKIGKEALSKDPDDQYFKDQVNKYQEAAKESDEGEQEQARRDG